MASAKFLEEALRTDVDESTVNAIVGSLETQLVTNVTSVQQQTIPISSGPGVSVVSGICNNNNNINNNSAIVTNGGPNSSSSSSSTPLSYSSIVAVTAQKNHGLIANGDLNFGHINNHNNNHFMVTELKTTTTNPSVGTTPTTASTSVSSVSSAVSVTRNNPVALTIHQQSQQQHQHHQTNLMSNSSTTTTTPLPTNIMSNKNNEPVKLVYPNQATVNVTGGGSGSGGGVVPSQSAVINMNNRVTFTSQSLPNGTINLATFTGGQQPQQTLNSGQHPVVTMMQTTSIAASTATVGAVGSAVVTQHHGGGSGTTVVAGNASIKSITQHQQPLQQQQQPTLVIQKQATNQNVVGTSTMMPGVQIVNMRPGTPTAPAQQKTVATVSPRVVTHMVGARPTNSAITLSALSNLQTAAGQPGQAILLKTENGQFQLLRVGPSPVTVTGTGGGGSSAGIGAGAAGASGQHHTQNLTTNTNQTIRLQTVPAAVSRFTGPPLALRKTIVSQQPQLVKTKANQQAISSSSSVGTTNIVVNSVSHTAPVQTINQTTVGIAGTVGIGQQQQPPIASVAPVPALTQQQQQHSNVGQPGVVMATASPTTATPANQQNTKEKCRKFLANLLELSSREPKPVERNVRTLIQELIDANVEPEEFCDRLERLLNASPQPCLIGFLKKSLPLLRQSLVTKELAIDGIKPPPHNVAFGGGTTITTHIPAQVRPIGQTLSSTQVRMVPQQATTRPIGQTTITRHSAPSAAARLQTQVAIAGTTTTSGHRMVNAGAIAQVRPGTTTIIPAASLHQSTPPALQPVSATLAQSNFTPGGAQIRSPIVATVRPPIQHSIRQTTPILKQQSKAALTTMKVGSTQIKQIVPNSSINIGQNNSSSQNMSNINSSIMSTATGTTTITTTPIVNNSSSYNSNCNSTTINNNNIINNIVAPVVSVSAAAVVTAGATATTITAAPTVGTKTVTIKTQNTSQASSKTASAKQQDKEKKALAAASSSFFQQSMSSSVYGDDDINDVAAMGGVNLAEESQRILGSTEMIGTQIRSCKDEVFLHLPALHAKIRQIMAKHGLDEPNNEVAVLVSHATQERLKNIVEKLAVIAEHRIDIIKVDPRYEITKDVRGQIKFLEELDKAEQKRHEEQEREMLMRAAKSRSKTEDPEQAKLKAKAKEMQRAEMEELRQRDANLTALQAIGPRKKPRLDGESTTTSTVGGSGANVTGQAPTPLRPRIKRVNLKDMIFYLEQERDSCRGSMLYKAYLK